MSAHTPGPWVAATSSSSIVGWPVVGPLATGNRRLLKLAKILDTADAEHRRKGEPAYDQKRHTHFCGTPGCAGGHWDLSKPGKRLGGHIQVWSVTFALTGAEDYELFGPFGCNRAKTAKEAAAYIRAFVKRRQS